MNPSEETLDALIKQKAALGIEGRLLELEKQCLAQQVQLDGYKNEREQAFKYGIITLIATVIGMVGWIVNLFTAGHIK